MEESTWIDVTSELLSCQKDLKLLELIKDDDITLEQCMQSQQINDDKMDPKFDISHKSTISFYLQNKMIRLPHQLSPSQIATVFAQVFQLQAAVLRGNSLPSSIYTFSYLYDESIFKDSLLFKALIDSVFCLGNHVYMILKDSCTIKEDDANISTMAYLKNTMSHDEVIEQILKAEKWIEGESKKSEFKESLNFILGMLRLRRMLHCLAKSSGKKYEHEKQKKILDDIQGVRKRLNALRDLPYKESNQVDRIFFPEISKVLRAHFGPRNSEKVSLSDAFNEISNVLEQIQLFFPLPTKIGDYKHRIEIIESKPYNVWGKSYLKVSIFAKEDYFFSVYRTEQILANDINDWIPLNQNIKNSDKFKVFMKHASQVVSEAIYRMLGNDMRWQWQCSKIYEDFNIIVHMANELDSQIMTGHREIMICSWFYYFGLNLMIKQMLVGLKIGLYHPNQAKSVFFVLQNLLGVFQRNAQVHLRKIDKSFLINFKEKNFNKKLKKKMNENSKRMFADFLFKNSLFFYFKSLFRIICILHHRKLVPNKFEDTEEIRIANRFKIFKNIMFVKVINHEDYRTTIEEVNTRDTESLNESIEGLKEMKDNLTLFVSQFDDHEVCWGNKKSAEQLIKSSIKASLVAMTLKMKANKAFEIDLSGEFPQVNMK